MFAKVKTQTLDQTRIIGWVLLQTKLGFSQSTEAINNKNHDKPVREF